MIDVVPSSSPPNPAFTPGSRAASAIVGLTLGMAFLIVGVWAAVLMARVWWAEAQVYGWSEVTATIVDAQVVAPARPTRDPSLSVRFRYEYAGRSYVSNRVSARPSGGYPDAYQLAGGLQPGSTWPCYVDPQHPSDAVLVRDGLWWGLAVLLPLAIGGGLGGLFLYAGWVSIRGRDVAPPATRVGRLVVRRLGSALLVISLALATYFIGVKPVALFAAARNWRACPCRIVASRVHASSHRMNTRYGVDIVFAYEYEGRAYVSEDYQLVRDYNRTFGESSERVGHYSPGAASVCYVNPSNPTQAVLDRSLPRITPFALFPLGALVAVGWGLLWSRRRLALRHDRRRE